MRKPIFVSYVMNLTKIGNTIYLLKKYIKIGIVPLKHCVPYVQKVPEGNIAYRYS